MLCNESGKESVAKNKTTEERPCSAMSSGQITALALGGTRIDAAAMIAVLGEGEDRTFQFHGSCQNKR